MRSMKAVMVVVTLLLSMGENQMASADMSPSQCKDERNLLVDACRPILYGQKLSADCCPRIREAHVECICPYVSPMIASMVRVIGVNKLVKKIEDCRRTVPRNFKCGSITSPP